MRTKIIVVFAFLAIGMWSCVYTQDHIQFKSYTINDGLSQSVVFSVAQDEFGALWAATQDGINRFNGQEFDVFSSDQGLDISNEYIHDVKKDNLGNLWFASNNGLITYNPKKELFKSFHLKDRERLELRTIAPDGNGNIWVGTAQGELYRFNKADTLFEQINQSTNRSAIIDIVFFQNKIIAAFEYEGIISFDPQTNKIEQYFFQKVSNDEIKINALVKSYLNELLIATNNGVYMLSESPKTSYISKRKENLNPFSGINVTDILFLSSERFIVASENQGIFLATNVEDTIDIVNYRADFFQNGSLNSDRVHKLFQDNKGVVWVCTQRGLNSFDPFHEGFRGVSYSVNLKRGLPTQNVWGFGEDKGRNYLYVAGDHGVSRYDRKNHTFQHFKRKAKKNQDYTTLGIYVLEKNKVLAASFDGLFLLSIDPTNPSSFNYEVLLSSDLAHRDFEKTYTVIPYKEPNTYLVGTRAGAYIINIETGEKEYIEHDLTNESSIGAGPIRLIFKTTNLNNKTEDRYFLCPSSGGVFELISTEKKGSIIQKPIAFAALEEKASNYFTSVVQLSSGNFYFGTMGGGIYFFSPETREIKHFSKKNGLPNNVVYGIEKSPTEQTLWISTNRGLVKMDLNSGQFITFSEGDGLMSDELNLGASFTSSNGDIYIGGIQGYNYFNPTEAITKKKPLNVYFTKLEVDNNLVTPQTNTFLQESIGYTSTLTLPYNQRSIKLSFFADDLSNPERIEYKYTLGGSDEVYEFIGNNNQLRFSSLSPGEYELKVFARHYNEEWNSNPATLTIIVQSPFWLAWWFYFILLSFVAIVVLILVRRSIEKERRQQVRLELKIAERTKEIREKSLEIENQKAALEKEKEKSERLLSNLLPKDTATQLKKDGRSAARDFSLVTVMFTDFVGFTQVAENMNAKDLVAILDRFFRKFDEIIDMYDLEKIKTIGDSYMSAGGVPIRNKTNPINTVLAAIKIQDYMQERKEEALKSGDHVWKLRIGINTGPVSAGVIGTKRYAYDVWGRTVNRAQRMEQMCTPEKIAISEDTYEYVHPYFEFKNKGKVITKSGLEINLYEVLSIKKELSVNGKGIIPNEAFHKLVHLHIFSKINYSKAERFIMQKLSVELDKKLHYHSLEHTQDVTRQAERIALGEGITDEGLFLLKTAASYHDAGFVHQYEKNEPIGAKMAEEILPRFGYTDENIERIKALIFATQVPHQPKNKLEEIICDADLDYLGRDDFHEIADRLRRELREHGKVDSDRRWDEIQVSFLKQHRYFTRTSIETRRERKIQNLEEIKKRLEENNYKD